MGFHLVLHFTYSLSDVFTFLYSSRVNGPSSISKPSYTAGIVSSGSSASGVLPSNLLKCVNQVLTLSSGLSPVYLTIFCILHSRELVHCLPWTSFQPLRFQSVQFSALLPLPLFFHRHHRVLTGLFSTLLCYHCLYFQCTPCELCPHFLMGVISGCFERDRLSVRQPQTTGLYTHSQDVEKHSVRNVEVFNYCISGFFRGYLSSRMYTVGLLRENLFSRWNIFNYRPN